MPGLNVSISEEAHKVLVDMAVKEGDSIDSILDRAVELYRRQKFLEQANEDFQALKNSADEWKEELEERELWDNTLSDGVEE